MRAVGRKDLILALARVGTSALYAPSFPEILVPTLRSENSPTFARVLLDIVPRSSGAAVGAHLGCSKKRVLKIAPAPHFRQE